MTMLNQVKIMGTTLLLIISSITIMHAYGLSIFEDTDLGIRLEYPSSWQEGIKTTDKESCSEPINLCAIDFSPIGTTWFPDFVQFTILKDQGRDRCECDNLTDFLKFTHERLMRQAEESTVTSDFQFIDDNQTTIGKNNNSAWSIQYAKSFYNPTGNKEPHDSIIVEWVAKVNDSFYEFNFQADIGEDFTKYYPDVKSMLDSVEFISNSPLFSKTPSDKIPSFMSGYNNNSKGTN